MDPETVENLLGAAAQRSTAPIDLGGLDRMSQCTASAALPGGHSARKHHLNAMIKAVRAALLAGEPEYAAALAASYDLTFNEREAVLDIAAHSKYKLPPGGIGPAHLYYDVERKVGLYDPDTGPPPDALAVVEVDIVWSEPGVLHISGGRPNIPEGSVALVGEFQLDADASYQPINHNKALAAQALLVAKWLDVTAIRPTTIVLGPGEHAIERGKPMLDHDLRVYEIQLRQILAHAEMSRKRLDEERILAYHGGPYCLSCPSAWCCPQMTGQLRALLEEERVHWISGSPEELDDVEARRLVGVLELAEGLASRTKRALRNHVTRHGDIVLDDGRRWGRQDSRYSYVDARIAFDELRKHVDESVIWRQLKLPLNGMRSALSEAKRSGKLGHYSVADHMSMLMWRIYEAGGLRHAKSQRYGRQYEKKQARPGIEAPPEAKEEEGAAPQADPPAEPTAIEGQEGRAESAG